MPGQQDLWPWLQSIIGNQGGALSAFNPIGSAQADVLHPNLSNPLGSAPAPQPGGPGSAGNDAGFNNPFQAAAGAPMVPGAAPGQGGIGSDARFPIAPPAPTPMGQGGIGSDARFPLSTAPAGSPSAPPRPARGPLAASGGGGATMKRTPGAPNLGYYQPNNRFVQIDRPNASAAGGMGRGGAPQMTALNLGGLFGGRGQPQAANPDVPAANAQPVSSSAPPAGLTAPDMSGMTFDANGNPVPGYGDLQGWGYGPLQRGRRWNPNSNDYSP